MQMLYNSDSFAVVLFDVPAVRAEGDRESVHPGLSRGGYEIVDKFARKEIFLEGALAEQFKAGVDALVEQGPTEEELDAFIGKSEKDAAGWVSFYWGKPPEELRRSKEIGDAILLQWLDLFEKRAKTTTK